MVKVYVVRVIREWYVMFMKGYKLSKFKVSIAHKCVDHMPESSKTSSHY